MKFVKANGGYNPADFEVENKGNCVPRAFSLARGVAKQGVKLGSQRELYKDTVQKMWDVTAGKPIKDWFEEQEKGMDEGYDDTDGHHEYTQSERINARSSLLKHLNGYHPNLGVEPMEMDYVAKSVGFKKFGNSNSRQLSISQIQNLSEVFKHGIVLSIPGHATFVYKGTNVDSFPSLNNRIESMGFERNGEMKIDVDAYYAIPEYTKHNFKKEGK